MERNLDWERDGRDWPNRQASRFVTAAGLRWHVQIMGQGPALLLVHGTGSASHSWRDMMPLLAEHFTVVAPDLPGHAFTGPAPTRHLTLPGMSRALAGLLAALKIEPALVAGHSAGAAILVRMCLDRQIAPRRLVSLNGALLPLHGLSGRVFSPLARLMAATPLVPRLFAHRARNPKAVHQLLDGTGSRLDTRGEALYHRLVSRPGHVAGVLTMMAHWDLDTLERDLPRLTTPLTLVAADRDRTISPRDARRVQAILPGADLVTLAGLGHLAHEERPGQVVDLLMGLTRQDAVLADT